jgi:hypothetical protein
MTVNLSYYDHRGGGNYATVAHYPSLVGDRLVYFDFNEVRQSWVIRDFVLGLKLDDKHSPLTVTDIEADAADREFPPWLDVGRDATEWQVYLRGRTTAVLKLRGAPISTTGPNRPSDTWLPLP